MQEAVSVLLLSDPEEPFDTLDLELSRQFITTCRAKTCQEAANLLDCVDPPHLVFTDATLPDGTWQDVLGIVAKAREAVNVVVVARFLDVQLYFETMEKGVCDFIIPPFLSRDLTQVVACAMEGVVSRRGGHAHAAYSGLEQYGPFDCGRNSSG